jgi:hypothetical protein
MKVEVKQKENTFKPITITITIEKESEVIWYHTLFNVPKSELYNAMPEVFKGLIDPDPTGDISDLLDPFIDK